MRNLAATLFLLLLCFSIADAVAPFSKENTTVRFKGKLCKLAVNFGLAARSLTIWTSVSAAPCAVLFVRFQCSQEGNGDETIDLGSGRRFHAHKGEERGDLLIYFFFRGTTHAFSFFDLDPKTSALLHLHPPSSLSNQQQGIVVPNVKDVALPLARIGRKCGPGIANCEHGCCSQLGVCGHSAEACGATCQPRFSSPHSPCANNLGAAAPNPDSLPFVGTGGVCGKNVARCQTGCCNQVRGGERGRRERRLFRCCARK